MSEHTIDKYVLNGAEFDVFYKLFIHGPQEDGDLPSKVGMLGLMEKKLSEKTGAVRRNRLTELGDKIATKHFLW